MIGGRGGNLFPPDAVQWLKGVDVTHTKNEKSDRWVACFRSLRILGRTEDHKAN